MFEKVNALTFKLKTHLGKVGGQTSAVGAEERRRKRRRKRRRRAAQMRRPATLADEKDIEFQLAHTYIYIQPTWQCLGKQFNTPIQTAALHHLHKLIKQIKILLKFFSLFPAPIFLSLPLKVSWSICKRSGQQVGRSNLWLPREIRCPPVLAKHKQQVADSSTHNVNTLPVPLSVAHLIHLSSSKPSESASNTVKILHHG